MYYRFILITTSLEPRSFLAIHSCSWMRSLGLIPEQHLYALDDSLTSGFFLEISYLLWLSSAMNRWSQWVVHHTYLSMRYDSYLSHDLVTGYGLTLSIGY